MKHPSIPAIALFALAGLAAFPASAATVLRPDETASKDVFVYAFRIPDTLGIPGAPANLNFDTESVPPSAAVPFGQTLGVAETEGFRLDPSDPNEPLREHTTRSLLEFDLSALGIAPDRVGAATLELTGIGNLFPFDPPSANFPIQVDVKRVLGAWEETGVTWDTRPPTGPVVASAMMTDGFETISFDLTALVIDWLASPAMNFGLELSQASIVPTPASQPGGRSRFAVGLFGSSAHPDAALRPTLTVSEVPLPAAAPLLIGALGLLGALRLRRRAG